MLRKLMLASKPLISNTWHKLDEVGQYTLEWFLNTLKDVIRPAYIWRKFDQNQCVCACVYVSGFCQTFELPPGQGKKVLAFFNFQKWLFVGPEIWSQNMTPFSKIKKNGFSIPWNFYMHAVFQLLVYCFKYNNF